MMKRIAKYYDDGNIKKFIWCLKWRLKGCSYSKIFKYAPHIFSSDNPAVLRAIIATSTHSLNDFGVLTLAIRYNSRLFKLLVEAGAPIIKSPTEFISNSHYQCDMPAEYEDVYEYYSGNEHDGGISYEEYYYDNLLDAACAYKNIEIVKYLIELGHPLTITNYVEAANPHTTIIYNFDFQGDHAKIIQPNDNTVIDYLMPIIPASVVLNIEQNPFYPECKNLLKKVIEYGHLDINTVYKKFLPYVLQYYSNIIEDIEWFIDNGANLINIKTDYHKFNTLMNTKLKERRDVLIKLPISMDIINLIWKYYI